jgi:hypothetical protein
MARFGRSFPGLHRIRGLDPTLFGAGPTTTRSLAGSQPNETGAITRILQALRSLTGSQPNETGTLARILQALRSLAGNQPNETGTLTRIKQAIRSLAGESTERNRDAHSDQASPAFADGIAAQRNRYPGCPQGCPPSGCRESTERDRDALPNSPGASFPIRIAAQRNRHARSNLGAIRSLVGNQPNETGTLSRIFQTFRSLTGSQPNETGTLARIYQTTRPLAGNQPAASGTLLVLLLTQHSESTHAEYLDGPYVDHAQYSGMARITEGEAVYLDPPVGRRRV